MVPREVPPLKRRRPGIREYAADLRNSGRRVFLWQRREIVQDHIAGWFGAGRSQLHVFSGHNLLNNAALPAEAGLGYAVFAGGSAFAGRLNTLETIL